MSRRSQLFILGIVAIVYLWVTPAEQPALPVTAGLAGLFGGPIGWTLHDYHRRWMRWTKKVGLR